MQPKKKNGESVFTQHGGSGPWEQLSDVLENSVVSFA